MGKTYKDKYRDEYRDQKTYRVIKMKKIKGWRKANKKEQASEATT